MTEIGGGTESKEFVADVQAVASQTGHEIEIISGCDLYELHEAVKAVGVGLLMGNSQAKYIEDDEKIAFARLGFPAYDRVGYQRRAIIGWRRDRSCRSDRQRDSGSCGRVKPWVRALFGMGDGSILTVLCGEGVRIFIKDLPRYSRKAYI